MMAVCIELVITLFLVEKPGSSKSLAKTIVSDAMRGNAAHEQLFKELNQVQMVSFQCSPLSTPDDIVGTFRQCSKFQKDQDLINFVSVVVLDEVGLAEDSPRMPLKTLHPFLEDGCQDDETPEEYMKVAFVGVSNCALYPAKMNRGILVQREVPDIEELKNSAKGICSNDAIVKRLMKSLIEPMAKSYLKIFYEVSNHREFFGLRDFYRLIIMVFSFVEKSKRPPTWFEMLHAVKRNFGGLEGIDPETHFRIKKTGKFDINDQHRYGDPECIPAALIEACLFDTNKIDRLIVVAEKQVVYEKFPIPLINRLEKHFLTINTMLSSEQHKVLGQLKICAENFVKQNEIMFERKKQTYADAFMRYHDDTCSVTVLPVWRNVHLLEREEVMKQVTNIRDIASSCFHLLFEEERQKKSESFITRTKMIQEPVARQDHRQISEENYIPKLIGKLIFLWLFRGGLPILFTKFPFRSRTSEFSDEAELNKDPNAVKSNCEIHESEEHNKDFCSRNGQTRISLEDKIEDTKGLQELSEYSANEQNLPSLEDMGSQLSLSHSVCPIESEETEVSSEIENNVINVIGEDHFNSPKKRLIMNFEAQKHSRENTRSFVLICYDPLDRVTKKVTTVKCHMEPFKRIQLDKSATDTFTKGSFWWKRSFDSINDDCRFLREITWLPLNQLPIPSIDITIALVHSPAHNILERIAKGETVGAHESMRYEILRVCTFRHYPGEGKPFRILLASAGLYYASEGDEVVCYCCGLRKSGWTEVHNPLKIHEQMKPSCDFLVRNSDVNVAIPDLPAENATKFRILDEIEDLSNAGVTGNSQLRCKTGNFDTMQNLQYRVYTPPPKHPQYAELSVRLESFKNWPTNIPQTAQIMAECGYYYAGFGDCVRCFHCGIGLRHWTEDDYPWIEHARWSKDCAYLREKKGEEFIQNVHLAIDDEEEAEDLIPATPNGQPADINQVTPREESSQILLTDPAQSVLEMGYQPRIIKKAIDIILHDEGRSDISAQKIMETIFMLEERESTSNLQQGIDSMNISGASAGSITQSESSRNTDLKQSTAEEPKSQTTKTGKIPANDAVSQSHKSSEGKAKGKAVSGQTHGSLQGGTEVDKILPKQHETANALNSPNSSLEDKKQGVASGTSKPRDTTKIKDENKRLKEQTVCKICLDKPVAIVFLPCGHLVTCAECAPAMRKCPICRALVKGSVKAFMS